MNKSCMWGKILCSPESFFPSSTSNILLKEGRKQASDEKEDPLLCTAAMSLPHEIFICSSFTVSFQIHFKSLTTILMTI